MLSETGVYIYASFLLTAAECKSPKAVLSLKKMLVVLGTLRKEIPIKRGRVDGNFLNNGIVGQELQQWGRLYWAVLHDLATRADTMRTTARTQFLTFLFGTKRPFQYLLPCQICRDHFSQMDFSVLWRVGVGEVGSRDRRKYQAQYLVWCLHNVVNRSIGKVPMPWAALGVKRI